MPEAEAGLERLLLSRRYRDDQEGGPIQDGVFGWIHAKHGSPTAGGPG